MMNKLEHKRHGNTILLTIPGVEHVIDEVVDEGDLRFGYAARVSVKHRHHHREPLSLLFICLQEEGQHGDGTAEKQHLPWNSSYFVTDSEYDTFASHIVPPAGVT